MKKILTTLVLALGAALLLQAQEERLSVMVAPPEGLTHRSAVTTLTSNLKQALALNDAAADSSRFILQTKVAELSKDVTDTAPPMFVTELEISLFITDTKSGEILSQSSFTVKGIDDSDQASYMDAVRKVKARDPRLRAMIKQANEYFFEHIY